jgi:hypothetical protein
LCPILRNLEKIEGLRALDRSVEEKAVENRDGEEEEEENDAGREFLRCFEGSTGTASK